MVSQFNPNDLFWVGCGVATICLIGIGTALLQVRKALNGQFEQTQAQRSELKVVRNSQDQEKAA